MFGRRVERIVLEGVATGVNTQSIVFGPRGGSVGSRQVLTFRLVTGEGNPVPVELSAFVMHSPVADGDHVKIEGLWKERLGVLRALRLDNLTTSTAMKGARF
jgi:hypothetical protein